MPEIFYGKQQKHSRYQGVAGAVRRLFILNRDIQGAASFNSRPHRSHHSSTVRIIEPVDPSESNTPTKLAAAEKQLPQAKTREEWDEWLEKAGSTAIAAASAMAYQDVFTLSLAERIVENDLPDIETFAHDASSLGLNPAKVLSDARVYARIIAAGSNNKAD